MNPVRRASAPRIQKKSTAERAKKAWDQSELATFLLGASSRTRVFDAYWLAGFTGMRLDEVIGLEERFVDLDLARPRRSRSRSSTAAARGPRES